MKKFIVLITASTVALSFPAYASMQDSLNSMFMSNVTNPGTFNSQKRSGFSGGGITLRSPIKPINLMAFDPPRVSAGCGGIDMYGGSFSFINKDQFTALLRQIMQNAVGLAFQTALQNICPSCSTLLNSMQQKIQELNQMASNTCAIANQMKKSISEGSMLKDLEEAGARVGTGLGVISGHLEGLFADSPAQSKTNAQATEASNPNAGNFTWRALHRSQAADAIGNASLPPDPMDPTGNLGKQFIMSLLGTSVATSNSNNSLPVTAATYPPLLTLIDLWSGGNDDLKVYACTGMRTAPDDDAFGPNSCDLGPSPGTTVPFDMASTQDYTRNMLYGDSTQITGAAIRAALAGRSSDKPGVNSIYGKIFNCTTAGCGLSTSEQNFLQLAGPLFNLLKDTQSDKASTAMMSSFVERPLAIMIAIKYGEGAIKAAKTAWSGVAGITMPENVNDNIKALQSQLSTLYTMKAQYEDDLSKARTIADTVRKNTTMYGTHY